MLKTDRVIRNDEGYSTTAKNRELSCGHSIEFSHMHIKLRQASAHVVKQFNKA
ncbi:hypothetical protein ACVIHC_004586 [Bradyrhizobium diazoefficiens]